MDNWKVVYSVVQMEFLLVVRLAENLVEKMAARSVVRREMK
jgi:hypothetical protein